MEAVIFDMDGLLIDSEPMWKEAEKNVFSAIGVNVTNDLSSQTASMTTKEVTEFWYRNYPWAHKSLIEVENAVINQVEALILQNGQPMEGVKYILEFFKRKNFKIGLSTNSPSKLISVVLNKLEISSYFQEVSSAEDEIEGKPHPAVYLKTSKKLKVEPSKCIAFEDSISGIASAKKAKIKTVAIPSRVNYFDRGFDLSDIKLDRLSDFSEFHLEAICRS
jgi:mannitol-1-/sugar-/sorbitol-6-/2-deoxyglucose-6-phosphatase